MRVPVIIIVCLLLFWIKTQAEIVNRVKDGDTFELLSGETVRMIGISAPEKGIVYGEESKNMLKELILGKNVQLKACSMNSDKDRFNRLLRYVELDGIDINNKMIELGMAQCYVKYKFGRLGDYKATEEIAKRKLIGIWKTSSKVEPNEIINNQVSKDKNILNSKNIILCFLILILAAMFTKYYFK